jgi:Tfp pilus assembly protein PilX
MNRPMSSERGSAMVMALGVLTVLALLAVIVLTIVSANKRTESSDYANNRSFYSADAASEAGVHWIHTQGCPPSIVDTLGHVSVTTAYTTLDTDHQYRFNVRYVTKKFRPGWSVEYKDYQYVVEATGASAQQSQSTVNVNAARLFREGY